MNISVFNLRKLIIFYYRITTSVLFENIIYKYILSIQDGAASSIGGGLGEGAGFGQGGKSRWQLLPYFI